MSLGEWVINWKLWIIGFFVWVGVWVFLSIYHGKQREIEQQAKAKWFYANSCKKAGYVAQRYGAIELYDCNGVPYIWADIPKADK